MDGTIDTPGPDGVFRLCWRGKNIYLLLRNRDATLVGAGGPGHLKLLEQALEMRGLTFRNIHALLLTHADVILNSNIEKLHKRCKLLTYINRLEATRLAPDKIERQHGLYGMYEKYQTRGIHYRAGVVDLYVADGDVLDQWYGMTVIGLPGPSAGNCGYYCRHLDVLFTGALHAQQTFAERILGYKPYNSEDEAQSHAKVKRMKPKCVLES